MTPGTADTAETKASSAIEPKTTAPSSTPETIDDVDAIGDLLGARAKPQEQTLMQLVLRRSRWLVLGVIAAVFLVPMGLWLSYQSSHVSTKNAAVRAHLSQLGARLDGTVAEVLVTDGDRVSAGQVLLRLEDGHLHAAAEEARAEITELQRQIELEQTTVEQTRASLSTLESEAASRVASAHAQVAAARFDVEMQQLRVDSLAEAQAAGGAASGFEVLIAGTELQVARSRLDEAKSEALVVEQTSERSVQAALDAVAVGERRIAVLGASVQAAEARLARAEANLEAATVRAPQDGAIVRRMIQPGAAVTVGQTMLSMWLGEQVWVEAWVDEQDLEHIRLGEPAAVTFRSFPGVQHLGTVEAIGMATDLEIPLSEVPHPRNARMSNAPTVGVRIELTDPPTFLVPGLSAVVAIEK